MRQNALKCDENLIIKNAIKCLSNGKDDEVYNVFSDNFKHATDLACDILGILTTAMLKHGTASELINKSIVKPIPKSKNKSLSDSKNYRAISKNNTISKVIDNKDVNCHKNIFVLLTLISSGANFEKILCACIVFMFVLVATI